MITVEDYIEVLAGIQSGGDSIKLDKSDYSLISSLARQTFRGTPYTDRQCELAKSKIIYYKDQLNVTDFKVNNLNKLRMPLREIDRSRWINLETTDIGESIAVRFTFQKKLISALEKLSIAPYRYDKIRKIQYFLYSEKALYVIVNAFKDRNFKIDSCVQDMYNKIELFTKEETIPGLYDYKLKNLPESATKLIVEELGEPSLDNTILYKDRSFKYGIDVTYTGETNSLEARIATRKEVNVALDSTIIKVDRLLLALENLHRHKLLVLVASGDHNNTYDDVVQMHDYIKNLIQPSEVSVSFRLDNVGEGLEFNRYIKKEGINNKVDNNTKVVYNLNNKLPKPLYNSDWIPEAIILLNSNGYIATRKVLDCYPNVDLIVHLNNPTMVAGYGEYYMKRGMHKI